MNGLISQMHLLNNAIQFAQQNHRVISQNMANVNTPGYKTRELSFAELLQAIDRGSTQSPPEFQLQETAGLRERTDGNNVDLDREIVGLRKNSMAYQTLVQVLGAKFDMMSRAING